MAELKHRPRLLFLCTGNSCRSQMAEGWLRHLAGDRFECFSAGSQPTGFVHPRAIAVMHEIGVDISTHQSKSIRDFLPPEGQAPELMISVCDGAKEACPVFPGDVARLHWPFDDPGNVIGSEDEVMAEFRRVRDEIRMRIETELLKELPS